MRYVLVFPGLGYRVINKQVLGLQPWSYLAQVAEALTGGDNEVLVVSDAAIDEGVLEALEGVGVTVSDLRTSTLRASDAVITPVALGTLSRVLKMLGMSGPVIGVLTTPLMRLWDAFINYLRVLSSRTQVASASIIKENLGFRLRRVLMCRTVTAFITPSKDLADFLKEMLGCELEVAVLYPRAAVQGSGSEVSNEVTYFGPLTEERGVVSLVKAFRKIVGAVRGYRLRLLIRDVGGAGGNRLRKILKRLGGDVVLSTGSLPRKELFATISRSSLIALPYRFVASTVPLAYLEALQLKGPAVLTTDLPGLGDHVRAYMQRPLSPTYTVGELASYLALLLEDEGLRRRIASAQARHAERLAQEVVRQAKELPRWLGDRVGSS